MRWRIALGVGVLALGALLLEGVARLVCRTDEARRERLLSGDDYWIDRWLAAEDAAPPEPGGRPRRAAEIGPLARGDPLHRHDPTLGWVPREGVRQEGLTTNSLGMRGPVDVPLEKPPGERRIVVVGDSFTFGHGVKDEEVWTEKLAQRIGGVRVLNLGVPGYGLDQQCLRLEELGMRLAPDLVLVGLFGPDLDRNELRFRDAPKPRFVLDGDGLRLDNVPVPTLEQLRTTFSRKRVGSYAWTMLRKIAAAGGGTGADAPKWELARRILDRMRAAAERGGSRFAVAYFPAKTTSFDREPDDYEKTVVSWAGANDVALVNVRETFFGLGSGRFREIWHNHWTPFGNEIVAEAVLAGLREFNAIPAR